MNSALPPSDKGERIAKIMARAGLCSRRDAEQWIAEGRVAVKGQVLTTPAVIINNPDDITVDGKPLPRVEKTRLFLHHKPAGLVTTAKDEQGRKTVFDSLPAGMPRVISVGRLDLNTEGLLLLTNDGALSRYMELPATGLKRQYRVRVHGRPDPKRIADLANGITVEGVKYGPIEATLDYDAKTANTWLTMTLREGKNREIRRVLESMELKVNRLMRLSYGPFSLGNLPEGGVAEIPYSQIKHSLPGFFKQPTKD